MVKHSLESLSGDLIISFLVTFLKKFQKND